MVHGRLWPLACAESSQFARKAASEPSGGTMGVGAMKGLGAPGEVPGCAQDDPVAPAKPHWYKRAAPLGCGALRYVQVRRHIRSSLQPCRTTTHLSRLQIARINKEIVWQQTAIWARSRS